MNAALLPSRQAINAINANSANNAINANSANNAIGANSAINANSANSANNASQTRAVVVVVGRERDEGADVEGPKSDVQGPKLTEECGTRNRGKGTGVEGQAGAPREGTRPTWAGLFIDMGSQG